MNQKYQLQDKIAKFYSSEISRLTNNIKSMEVKTIGNYRGFEIQNSYDSMMKIMSATLKNKFSYQVELGTDAFGNITRINNVLDGIEERISKTELNLENIKKQKNDKIFPIFTS